MKNYFISVFVISLLIGLLERLTYRSDRSFSEKAALSVILAFAVISPLPSLLSETTFDPLVPEYGESVGEGEYLEVGREAFESGISKQIADKFSLREEDVTVRCSGFDFSVMRAEKINVVLSVSAGRADPEKVKRYVDGLNLGECEVSFEIG